MKRRIFIAINLPENVQNGIARAVIPMTPQLSSYRLVRPDLWHVTLIFLGDQDEDSILRTIDVLNNVVKDYSAPTVTLESISFGPTPSRPRMVWVRGSKETSRKLAPIYESLKDELDQAGVRFENREKLFDTHITVARLKKGAVYGSKDIQFSSIDVSFEPETIECMESILTPSGPEYTTLSSHRFDF